MTSPAVIPTVTPISYLPRGATTTNVGVAVGIRVGVVVGMGDTSGVAVGVSLGTLVGLSSGVTVGRGIATLMAVGAGAAARLSQPEMLKTIRPTSNALKIERAD